MVQVSIRVCDVCGDPKRQTRPYKITQGNREVFTDLCENDSAMLEHLLPKRGKRGSPPARSHFHTGVTTVEEIEAQKSGDDKSAPPSRRGQGAKS